MKWPPYPGKAGEGWTLVDRTGGTRQWASDGKPTDFFQGDTKAGDAMGGMWHVIRD